MKKILLLIIIMFCTACSIGEKTYYCDDGDELKGTTCIKKNSTPAISNYTCKRHPGTYLNGNQCVSYSFSSIAFNADVDSYTCYSGYLDGDECIIETSYNAYEE